MPGSPETAATISPKCPASSPRPPRRRRTIAERRALALKLAAEGVPPREIRRRTGRSRFTVWRWLKDYRTALDAIGGGP